MEVVDGAPMAPGYCLFTKDTEGPFLDLKMWVNEVDPYAYIHVPYVEEMGRAIGMVPRAEVEKLQEQILEMEAQLAEVRTVLDAMDQKARAEEVLNGAVAN